MFDLHSRVALIDGCDQVYLFALAGTEGWVREQKVDEEGYDLVKIEWDKDHWRYNGQSDGWTFANHFKVVGPPSPPEISLGDIEVTQEEIDEQLGELREMDFEVAPSDDEISDYIESLSDAMEAASEAEAFLMIAVKRIPNPENPSETIYMPQIFCTSTTKESALLLDLQLAECASSSYEEMVYHLIDQLKKYQSNDD